MTESAGRIVIIDDDEIVNEVLTYIFREEYIVRNFTNAEDALSSGCIVESDVVITDVDLPGMSGINLLMRIHEQDADMPVVVITGFNDIDAAISALKHGAFDFLLKPFNNDQIAISVRKAVERRKLLRENVLLVETLKQKNAELQLLNRTIQSRNAEIEREMDIAANLQQCLFPITFPKIDTVHFAVRYKPVEKISGDFFDFLTFSNERFALVFADVSGHGVPAALYSAMLKTAISSIGPRDLSPADFITEINRFLINAQSRMSYNYATVCYALFDLSAGTISFCNAGIPSPVLVKQDGGIEMLASNGPFVGIFDSSSYIDQSMNIEHGDKVVFYTDGAYECMDDDGSFFGQKRFIESIKKRFALKIEGVVNGVSEETQIFCGGVKYTDDVTIVGVQIT